MKKYGFVKVAAIVPELKIANPDWNVKEIIRQIGKHPDSSILAFPELALTGYTCEDLFRQETLWQGCLDSLRYLLAKTEKNPQIFLLGLPLKTENVLYDGVAVLQQGKILGFVPARPSTEESRYFKNCQEPRMIDLLDQHFPIGENLLFQDANHRNITFEIIVGTEREKNLSPRAGIVFVSAAHPELVTAWKEEKNYLLGHSASRSLVFVGNGASESSTHAVYAGNTVIAENRRVLKEGVRLSLTGQSIEAIVDGTLCTTSQPNPIVVDIPEMTSVFDRTYQAYPFVPEGKEDRIKRCQEILELQATALARRLKQIGTTKCVLGISGGLDSTLAFLVILEAYKKLEVSNDQLLAVTMPGFGTTDRTYQNAVHFVESFGATLQKVDIRPVCTQHLKDIGHDLDNYDITYENAQARMRTQILMDIANQVNGIVVGTGDLSELALGWCTYNGDQMSMYGVNADIPKTLVKSIVQTVADTLEGEAREVLLDILETPISPELLPPDQQGNILQKTENSVGPYVLHDFYLYYFTKGYAISKIRFLAHHVFSENFTKEEIDHWLAFFVKRFFTQQFKRSCSPDGPRIGRVSLAPSDFKIATDADFHLFQSEIEKTNE